MPFWEKAGCQPQVMESPRGRILSGMERLTEVG